MLTRRDFLGAISAVSATGLINSHAFGAGIHSAFADSGTSENVTQFVKIAIGTGGHGHTYPGATVPFGMVQLSPDTFNDGWDWCSGYHYSDKSIMGFSHTHLSGTGASDLLDVLLMPGTGPAKLAPGSRENPEAGYRSRFSHEDEIAEPGYYSVVLKDYKIRAELSATERAGIHAYTFPASDSSHFIFDMAHISGIDPGPIQWAELKVVDDHTITGGRCIQGWAPGRQVFFAAKFSKPFASAELFSDDKKVDAQQAKGKVIKSLLHYHTTEGEVIHVKVGISGVSAEGALKNVDTEIPDWDFSKVRHAAHAAWQRELSSIRIETNNRKHREIFYTSLYHMLVAPTLFDDVDWRYRGMDGEVHTLPAGLHNYSTFSLWDTYRAVHPVYTLALGGRVPDLVNCLVRMAEESPDGPPVWPLGGKETGCMTGYHSAVVMAEASRKGFTGIDYKRAYASVKKRALVDDYRGLGEYRKLGYIPCDVESESASKTCDYAYDDWAVAQLARAAGETEDAKLLTERSKNYRHLYDKTTTFIRPKLKNGQWAEPFSANEMGHGKEWHDYTESNPWETTFSAQHDPRGLADLLGGKAALEAKLDGIFAASPELPADAPPDIAGLVGQYAQGNEPSHHIAYLYAYAGVPYKTQARVRSLLETQYDNQPNGLAGNEDCGQMSAWFVISALGFYAVDPVSGNYVFGTPLFDRAVVRLVNSKELVLEAKRSSVSDQYIQSVTFNGTPFHRAWFSHAEIANGGTFVFTMGSSPNLQFGGEESAIPPSLSI
jgi:predicted alpha-1,2-mannosidase